MNHVTRALSGRRIDRRCGFLRSPRQDGFALIVSLLILVVLTLLAVTGLRSSIVEEQVSGNQKMAASALFGAEQGVSQALEDMFNGTISDTDTGSEDDINWSEGGEIPDSGTGYSADYTVSHLVRDGAQVEDDDGRRYFVIDSTARTTTGEAQRTLEVAVALEWGGGSNIAGLIGCQGVTGLSNVVTSSYSSTDQDSDGDRGDIATTDAGAFMYLVGSSDMDIVGEVRSTGAIFMDSDAVVRRDALANLRITVKSGDIYGSAYTNDTFYQCTRCVHGSIYQGPTVTPNPLVPLPQCDPLDIDGIFTDAAIIKSDNNNLEIAHTSGSSYSGTPSIIGLLGVEKDYYFSNFTLDGDSVLVNGNVRIYVDDDFTIKSDARLTLGPNSSLKVYVERGNAWIDSNSRVNHDPANFFPACIHPEDDDKNNSPPAGCPVNMHLYSLHADTVKDRKVTSSYDEPDVWDDSQDIAGVKVDSNSEYFGLIYAPRSHVVLYSNAQIYGSVRGRFVTTDSNLGFYYDEDLDDLWTGNPSDYKLVYWTEKYPE